MVTPAILGALSIEGLIIGYTSEPPNNVMSDAVTASIPSATVYLLNSIARGAAAGTLMLVVLVAILGLRSVAKYEL